MRAYKMPWLQWILVAACIQYIKADVNEEKEVLEAFVHRKSSDLSDKGPNIPCHGVFYQVGPRRSASTLQWWTLCSALRLCALRYGVDPKLVKCNKYQPQPTGHKQLYSVVTKCHPSIAMKGCEFPPDPMERATVLCTSPTMETPPKSLQCAHTQKYPRLLKLGVSEEVYTIAQRLRLNTTELMYLQHHIRWWSVLRQCCGPQSSKDQRMRLAGKSSGQNIYADEHPASPKCHLYNISQVEYEVFNSFLGRMFPVDVAYGGQGESVNISLGFCRKWDRQWEPGGKKENSHVSIIRHETLSQKLPVGRKPKNKKNNNKHVSTKLQSYSKTHTSSWLHNRQLKFGGDSRKTTVL